MFQEFVNRSGLDVRGHAADIELGARRRDRWVAGSPSCSSSSCWAARTRSTTCSAELRSGEPLHPLLERIMRIHVTEEARHLSFARHYLKRNVPAPRADPAGRAGRRCAARPRLHGRVDAPTFRADRRPLPGSPKAVLAEAYFDNPEHRAETLASLRKVRRLCDELGLLRPPTAGCGAWSGYGESAVS